MINYFNKKHLYKITESELTGVLNRIDKINIENSFNGIIEESLNNIVSFVNSGEVGNNKISKEIIELFLWDKLISDPSNLIDKKLGSNSEEKFKIEDFKKIIFELKDEIKHSLQEEQINIRESIERLSEDQTPNLEEEMVNKQIDFEDSEEDAIE